MLETAMAVVYYIMVALTLWAFVDCLLRPAAAFPAVGRQTKLAWLAFLGAGVIVEYFFGGVQLLGIAAVILAVYYFADVRTKVLAVSRR